MQEGKVESRGQDDPYQYPQICLDKEHMPLVYIERF